MIVETQEFTESKQQEKREETSPDGFMNIPDGIDEQLPFA